MKVKTYGKQMPRGEARPLGTPKRKQPRCEGCGNPVGVTKVEGYGYWHQRCWKNADGPRRELAKENKDVDTDTEPVVDLHQSEGQDAPQAVPQAGDRTAVQEKTMILTLKTLSRNGKRAIYVGAAQSINYNLGVFPDKVAPQTIEVADGTFAPAVAKVDKVKETKEERKARLAALPKPTLAEKAAKAQKRADDLAKKLAAANASL